MIFFLGENILRGLIFFECSKISGSVWKCCGATSILNGQWLMVTFVGLGVQKKKKKKRFQWCRWVNSPLSTHWRGCNGPAADSDWPFIGFGKRQCAFHSLFRLFQLLLGKSTQLKAYFYVWPDCWFDSSKESNLVFTVPKFLPFFCFIRFRMTHFKFSPIGRTNFKIENITIIACYVADIMICHQPIVMYALPNAILDTKTKHCDQYCFCGINAIALANNKHFQKQKKFTKYLISNRKVVK